MGIQAESATVDRSLQISAPLVLEEGQRRELVAWARQALPLESCGLLVGELRVAESGAIERLVRRATRSENLAGAGARNRFVLDPGHWVQVENEVVAQGLQVLGVWHSHPADRASACGAAPSALDVAGAIQGWSYLIVSVDAAHGSCLRSWRVPPGPAGAAVMLEERLGATLSLP